MIPVCWALVAVQVLASRLSSTPKCTGNMSYSHPAKAHLWLLQDSAKCKDRMR